MYAQDYMDGILNTVQKVRDYNKEGDSSIFPTYFDLMSRLEGAEFCRIVDSNQIGQPTSIVWLVYCAEVSFPYNRLQPRI